MWRSGADDELINGFPSMTRLKGIPKVPMTSLSRFVLELLSRPPKFHSLDNLLRQQPVIQPALRSFISQLPINEDHNKIRSERYAIPRPGYPHVPKSQYYNFLRELYPPQGSFINRNKLFLAYSSMPKPQPLHIQPHHFEEMMSKFCLAEGENGRKAAVNGFFKIINTLKKCGIPVSTKEMNCLLYLKNYNEESVVNVKRNWTAISQSFKDISTVNIFLRYAVRADNYVFVKEILDWMKEEEIKMDRVSYDCLLRYMGGNVEVDDCTNLLRAMLRDGITLDVAILNTVMSTLVNAGDVNGAETILRRILELGPKPRQIRTASARSKHLTLMMYIDSLQLQDRDTLLFIPSPTFDTFKPLLNHYSNLSTFDPSKITYIFQLMLKSHTHITSKHMRNILQVFRDRDAPITDQLRLIQLFLTSDNLKVDHNLYEELIFTCQKQERFQSPLVNDIEESWNSEAKMPYWKKKRDGSNMKKLAQDSVGRLIAAL